MDQELYYIIEEAISDALAQSAFSMLLGLLGYIFYALSLYTIAQRRGINNPWLAWIPMANIWILGSISDQYRYVVKGQTTNRRFVLVIAEIVVFLLGIVASAMALSSVADFFRQLAYNGSLDGALSRLGATLIITIPLVILAVVGAVYEIMCLYDLFVSCDQGNGLLFFILSIVPGINSICKPVFMFICRDKDGGMPARRRRGGSSGPDEEDRGFGGRRSGREDRGDSWDDEF